MSRRGFRERWRTEVIRSSSISDAVRVVLLVLADTMTDAGYVSVPRSKLAEAIGRTPRRVNERLSEARSAGYLDVVRRGAPGRTAEYQAILPSRQHGADMRPNGMGRSAAPVRGRTSAPPWTRPHGADGGPANTRVTNATSDRDDTSRDTGTTHSPKGGSEERAPRDSFTADVFCLDHGETA